MVDQFNEFIKRLTSGETDAWDIIRFEAEHIIEYKAKEENTELLWVVDGTIIPDKKEQLFDKIFSEFKKTFFNKNLQFSNFKELKLFILKLAEGRISDGFNEFFSLLKSNHQKAWWRLDKDMNNKITYWLISSKRCTLEIAQELYNESLEKFSQLIKEKELHFKSSKSLKSYIFKIADIKFKEKVRSLARNKIYSESTQYEELFLIDGLYDIELDHQVDRLLELLDPQERKIVYGYYFYNEKLKTIAEQMKMKEENCRIIKYRAIKKLRTIFNNDVSISNDSYNTIMKSE